MKDLTSNTKPEQVFISADGKVIKNILELKKALKNMKQEIFNCHVNPNKNDFYNWIKDIYQDKMLADDIKKTKTPEDTIKIIEKKLEDIDKEKQQEVKEIIDAIEKVKNGPIKKPIKMDKTEDIKQTKETTRKIIIKKLSSKFASEQKKKFNVKKLNLIPVCKLDREDMINQIKRVYENG